MRFTCPACRATFQTASEATAPVPVRLLCAGCGSAMEAAADVVDLHRLPTRRYDLTELKARLEQEREASSAGPATAGQVWFVGVQGRKVGPMTLAGLAGLKERGQLSAASLVWREGWPLWAAAEAVQELRPLLGLPVAADGEPEPALPSDAEQTDPDRTLPAIDFAALAAELGPAAPVEPGPARETPAPADAPPAAEAPTERARSRTPRAVPSFSAVVSPPPADARRFALGLALAAAALGLAVLLAGRSAGAPPAPAPDESTVRR